MANRDEHELRLLRALVDLRTELQRVASVEKALHRSLLIIRAYFQAESALCAVWRRDVGGLQARDVQPTESIWDLEELAAFYQDSSVRLPETYLVATLRRRGRLWGLMALHSETGFPRQELKLLYRMVAMLEDRLEQLDGDRAREVRSRIDRKVLEQLRPRDLFYQVLHGLRSLTRYDHSSAILIHDAARHQLEVVAEQISWLKGKSEKVGLRLPLSEAFSAQHRVGRVFAFEREGEAWTSTAPDAPKSLASLLDYNRESRPGYPVPREEAMLLAPMYSQGEVLGFIKVAAQHRGSFGAFEENLLRDFMFQVTQSVRNLQHTATLESEVLDAERKHALADLARGVAHDINNAVGGVLPLVQQMRAELDSGMCEPDELAEDLGHVEHSLQVCRRIFGGMLGFARSESENFGEGGLRRALESTLAILHDGMQRRGIEVEMSLEEESLVIPAKQSDLDQLFLNLLSNAKDAMPRGGQLRIEARRKAEELLVDIEDTGTGIEADLLHRIQEPFFTTKKEGSGLGLAVCRSIVWSLKGSMKFESTPGQGTCIRLRLPALAIAEKERTGRATS